MGGPFPPLIFSLASSSPAGSHAARAFPPIVFCPGRGNAALGRMSRGLPALFFIATIVIAFGVACRLLSPAPVRGNAVLGHAGRVFSLFFTSPPSSSPAKVHARQALPPIVFCPGETECRRECSHECSHELTCGDVRSVCMGSDTWRSVQTR